MPTRPPVHGQELRGTLAAARSSLGVAAEGRGTAADRGYSSRWQRCRALFLLAHPLCVGYPTPHAGPEPATVVDHKIPHKGNPHLFWDEENWQSLCAECHGKKTAMEDGGFGRKEKGFRVRGPGSEAAHT